MSIKRCCTCKKQEKHISNPEDHCLHPLEEMIHEGKGEGNIMIKCYKEEK